MQADFAYGGHATNDVNQLVANALTAADKAASVAIHAVVSARPDTGRPAIFIHPYITCDIRGISAAETQEIVELVYPLIDSQEFRWEHQWSVGDTIMRENRSGLMHNGRLDYPRNEARTFLQTTVRGTPIKIYRPPKNL